MPTNERGNHTMKYTAVITKGGKIHRITVEASNMLEARKSINELFAGSVDKFNVFPITSDENGVPYTDGIIEGALFTSKSVAKYVAVREGLDHQWQLLNDITARKKDGAAADCVQEAATALLDSIKRGLYIEEQYDKAYNAVNRWMYQNGYRNWIKGKKCDISIDQLDDHSMIVEVSPGMFSFVREDSNYIPYKTEREKARTANYIAVILETLHELTEPQARTVYHIVSRGRSIASAAKEENICISSSFRRIENARRKAQICRKKYNEYTVCPGELEAMFRRLSPIAREIAIDVLESI